MKLVCIKHPTYDGESSPILSCKACCSIFIASIKARGANPQKPFDTYEWLAEKARVAKQTPLPPKSGEQARSMPPSKL
jgi:hypothetical protein